MGKLHYAGETITIEDRVLAHLQIVMVNRLRRRESFTVSWLNALSLGDGRVAIWVDPAIPLRFSFSGSRLPSINPDWIAALERSASSSTGLIVLGEDGRPARCG